MGKRKVIRVVLDTNVVVSALLFGGAPGKLIEPWQKGTIQPLLSQPIFDEYLRVLTYPKFELSEQELNFLLYQEILPFFEIVTISAGPQPTIIQDDPSDDMFLYCAKAGNASIIVSGDRHLLELKSYEQIEIMALKPFLATLG
jgi:uncharacterized protein